MFFLPYLVGLGVFASEVDDQERIEQLCLKRDAFLRSYKSPKQEKLQVIDNLGTNNLGNPFLSWYFPADSARYCIFLVRYPGGVSYFGLSKKGQIIKDSGALVYLNWHGKHTTTDWVIKLAHGQFAKASGTVSSMIDQLGHKPVGKLSLSQKAFLQACQAYAGLENGRGPNEDMLASWFVDANGRTLPASSEKEVDDMDGLKSRIVGMTMEELLYLGIRRSDRWLDQCLDNIDSAVNKGHIAP